MERSPLVRSRTVNLSTLAELGRPVGKPSDGQQQSKEMADQAVSPRVERRDGETAYLPARPPGQTQNRRPALRGADRCPEAYRRHRWTGRWTVITAQCARRTTSSALFPISRWARPVRPWVPMKMASK